MKKCIWKYEECELLRDSQAGHSIVLVGGCFDLMHYGHVRFLQEARKHAEILVVALESDEHIETYKKRKPVHSQQERAEILTSMRSVDHVVTLPFLQSDEEYATLVKNLKPHIIAVTSPDKHIDKKRLHASQYGAHVVEVIPVISQFATRKIVSES